MNYDAIGNEQIHEEIDLSKNHEVVFFLIGICGWLWDCVVFLPEGNTLADNGLCISRVLTKEAFCDYAVLCTGLHPSLGLRNLKVFYNLFWREFI